MKVLAIQIFRIILKIGKDVLSAKCSFRELRVAIT
jgi:hypothetical protein